MNELFFYLSKLLWLIFAPDSLFVILLCIGLILLITKKYQKAQLLLTILTVFTLIISIFPIGGWLLYPLETHFETNPKLPEKIEGIIILGGSIKAQNSAAWQQLETNDYHERLSHSIILAHTYPQARLLFTGGNSSIDRSKPAESDFILEHLIKSGIQKDRIIVEPKARNTAENAQFSKLLIQPEQNETWVLVTTAFHMPRAIGVFCQQGWKVIPFPVDHQTIPGQSFKPAFQFFSHAEGLTTAMHEWLGLIAYFLTGKTSQLLPNQCS